MGEVKAQRRQAQQEVERTLDSEAISASPQTERAVIAIAEDRVDEALAGDRAGHG